MKKKLEGINNSIAQHMQLAWQHLKFAQVPGDYKYQKDLNKPKMFSAL